MATTNSTIATSNTAAVTGTDSIISSAASTTMSSSVVSSAADSASASASSAAAASSSSSVEASITSSIAASVSSAILSPTTTSTSVFTPSSTATPTPSSTEYLTSTVSASYVPPTTVVSTSLVTQTPTSGGSTDTTPVTVIVTTELPGSSVPVVSTFSSSSARSTSSSASAVPNTGDGSTSSNSTSHGLSTAGVTAIAVVVPVVVVALLVLAGILLWRKRKQKKAAEETRRREVEEYGFNPNNDPTLPTVASENGNEMAEDHSSGYRGWGAAAAGSRKMSTTLSGGHTQGQLSDSSGTAYASGSPNGGHPDDHSDNALVSNRDTMDSDEIGNLGAAPVAGANSNPMRRGVSNASSHYSHTARSDTSEGPPMPSSIPSQYDYNPNQGYGYSQHGPYGDGTYGGGQDNGMPIVRDVSARRDTRIQQPGNYPQGNSGIAQNF